MKYIVLLGRVLFTFIFISGGFHHFKSQTIQYAASQGVYMANLLVPLSGIMAIAGGISVLIGLKAKWGAWLLVLFLIPVTLTMHNFWAQNDSKEMQIQMVMFTKNLSMLGGALIIAYFGSGPFSFDNKLQNPKVNN